MISFGVVSESAIIAAIIRYDGFRVLKVTQSEVTSSFGAHVVCRVVHALGYVVGDAFLPVSSLTICIEAVPRVWSHFRLAHGDSERIDASYWPLLDLLHRVERVDVG